MQECPSGLFSREMFRLLFKQFFPFGDSTRFSDYVFSAMDRNNTGSIEFHEFLSILSVMTRGRIEDKLELAFHLYDIDGDGFIAKSEMYKIVDALYRLA